MIDDHNLQEVMHIIGSTFSDAAKRACETKGCCTHVGVGMALFGFYSQLVDSKELTLESARADFARILPALGISGEALASLIREVLSDG